jgi:hypothetical protein
MRLSPIPGNKSLWSVHFVTWSWQCVEYTRQVIEGAPGHDGVAYPRFDGANFMCGTAALRKNTRLPAPGWHRIATGASSKANGSRDMTTIGGGTPVSGHWRTSQ